MAEKNEMSALRGKIREVYRSEDAFADAFGMTRQNLQLKLKGQVGWSLDDVKKAAELLGIENDQSEIYRIFFKA